MTHNQLFIGQTVRNFGILAKVDGFHEITGDPLLRGIKSNGKLERGGWLANAELCEPVDDGLSTGVWMHKDGLVALTG
jgi:hypothetical protein